MTWWTPHRILSLKARNARRALYEKCVAHDHTYLKGLEMTLCPSCKRRRGLWKDGAVLRCSICSYIYLSTTGPIMTKYDFIQQYAKLWDRVAVNHPRNFVVIPYEGQYALIDDIGERYLTRYHIDSLDILFIESVTDSDVKSTDRMQDSRGVTLDYIYRNSTYRRAHYPEAKKKLKERLSTLEVQQRDIANEIAKIKKEL